jgi:hypothetical protein
MQERQPFLNDSCSIEKIVSPFSPLHNSTSNLVGLDGTSPVPTASGYM